MIRRSYIFSLILVSLLGLNACDSEPPVLMKASKQFESDEIRDRHIAYMRKNHMDALKHKRDETMYNGIRTEKNSINACINCHVPESYNGKVLRHTDQEHFCTTCHTYVAAQLDCFECHVDHPMKAEVADNSSSSFTQMSQDTQVKKISELDQSELLALAFTHSKSNDKTDLIDNLIDTATKPSKSGGVSFKHNQQAQSNTSITTTNNSEAISE